mmetsp:Transcript_22588/g.53326  ORF Transcript_22588/g.53326 Transcript_22588/m.53326 type:complete len:289 (-) Transcript_22588:65-931(-)
MSLAVAITLPPIAFVTGIIAGALLQRLRSRARLLRLIVPSLVVDVAPAIAVAASIVGTDPGYSVAISSAAFAFAFAVGRTLQPVGLTGSIATGKTAVSGLLKSDGAFAIIDVDQIAHDILRPKSKDSVFERIVAEFGDAILTKDGDGNAMVDRRALGAICFRDSHKRRKLNSITHPTISKVMMKRIIWGGLRSITTGKVVVVDIPLLFEGKLEWLFGIIVVVACSPEQQLQRLHKRNADLSLTQCEERIASQLSLDLKQKRAQIVLSNDGTLADLAQQVERIKHLLAR